MCVCVHLFVNSEKITNLVGTPCAYVLVMQREMIFVCLLLLKGKVHFYYSCGHVTQWKSPSCITEFHKMTHFQVRIPHKGSACIVIILKYVTFTAEHLTCVLFVACSCVRPD